MHFSPLAKFLFFCFSNGCLEKSDRQVALLVVLRFEFSGFTLSTADIDLITCHHVNRWC